MTKNKLISCPECQKESDYNNKECQYCAYPFENAEKTNSPLLNKKITPAIAFLIIVGFLGIVALISLSFYK